MRDREHVAIRSYNYSIDIGLARRLRWTRALDLHQGHPFRLSFVRDVVWIRRLG